MFKKTLLPAALAALITVLPFAASAVTLRIMDMETGAQIETRGTSGAAFSGFVGGFDVQAAGIFISDPDRYELSGFNIQATGGGHMRLVLIQNDLAGFGSDPADIVGVSTLTNATGYIRVRHEINTGSGWTQVGGGYTTFNFRDGNSQTETVRSALVTGDDTFRLRTIVNLVSGRNDQASDVAWNLSATAPVPLPATGLMLMGGLAGLVGLRRRKKTA